MSLPTARDINPFPEDLDGKVAEEHFLGKTIDEAVILFTEDSLTYQEDLLFMGPVAFCFYVRAAIAYVMSPDAEGDSDIVNCLQSIFFARLQDERIEIAAARNDMKQACDYMLAHWSKFDVDPTIYGDVRGAYQRLLEQL